MDDERERQEEEEEKEATAAQKSFVSPSPPLNSSTLLLFLSSPFISSSSTPPLPSLHHGLSFFSPLLPLVSPLPSLLLPQSPPHGFILCPYFLSSPLNNDFTSFLLPSSPRVFLSCLSSSSPISSLVYFSYPLLLSSLSCISVYP